MSEHDWQTCRDSDCRECDELIAYGIIMACDECDSPGHQDCDTWTLMDDGRTLCTSCRDLPTVNIPPKLPLDELPNIR